MKLPQQISDEVRTEKRTATLTLPNLNLASSRSGGVLAERLVFLDPVIGLLLGSSHLSTRHSRSQNGDAVLASLVSAGLG
jgi:hypothetical protein